VATIAIGVSPTSGSYTAKVPVNSLGESGVPPEEGDKVQFSVDATVQSVSGGSATLSIDAVNGEPVSEEAAESPEEEAGEEGEETLRRGPAGRIRGGVLPGARRQTSWPGGVRGQNCGGARRPGRDAVLISLCKIVEKGTEVERKKGERQRDSQALLPARM
jgi:hypothetical protein